VIHSDLERGFFRAEVIHYDALVTSGSLAKGREAGKLRIEGKDYRVQDGDVLLIRFNV
jgi:ribosome-binding ATPase YchF (GTP1/OBG family)